MPAMIFHQNMRVYGGAAPARNAVFQGAMTAISGITGQLYWAAGFTEITNAGASIAALTACAQALDGGLGHLVVIEVGTTALGMREYLGIAWDNANFPVAHAGQVLKNPVTGAWQAYNTLAGAIPGNQTITLPALGAPLAADSRGLAYIAGTNSGSNFILGFMHNMYNLGDRYGAFYALNTMAARARAAIGGAYAAAEIIIGGDFNVHPPAFRARRRLGPNLATRAEIDGGGAYVNTTLANPYDFWQVSNLGLGANIANVFAQTRVAGGSDHAAITITR